MTETIIADLDRVARTAGKAAIYIGNGHAAWEAAIANILAPGQKALVVATGRFGLGWAQMARHDGGRGRGDRLRLPRRPRPGAGRRAAARRPRPRDPRRAGGADRHRLLGPERHRRRCARALDAAGHPALLVVDCIACLGCDRFEMDAWGVDVMVAACQKGLMTPPGLAFTFHGPKAEAARRALRQPLLGLGPAHRAERPLRALLRHGADPPPLRPARRARHDPRRGGARGGLGAARASSPGRSGRRSRPGARAARSRSTSPTPARAATR